MSCHVTIDSVSESQWTQYAQQFEDYSIYQTCAYQQVRGQIDDCEVHRLVVRADNAEVLTMCQIRAQRIRPLGIRIGYAQWGPLFRTSGGAIDCPVDVLNVLRDACFGLGIDVLRLAPNLVDDPAGKEISAALEESGFLKLQDVPPYHTTSLSLGCDNAALRKGLHQSWRRMLHKAERAGVETKEHTDQGPFGMLERFYADLARRKGLKGVDPDVFARTQSALPESEKMCLMVGYCHDEPVTVHVTSNLGATGVFLLSASSQEGYECRASYLAWWRAILRSSDLGMKNYDTGGLDFIKAPDIARFKAGMGGTETFHIGTFEAYADRRASVIWRVSKRLYRLVKW